MNGNRLCLGTAQIGMQYGIKNVLKRQPTQAESFTILKTAIDYGIDTFDTAGAYGNAEEILGAFGIRQFGAKVISKLYFTEEERECKKFEDLVERKICISLERMKLFRMYGCLLHTAADLYNKKIMERLYDCKRKGLIEYIGVSIYEVKDALAAVQNQMIDIIQIPYNILDQRLEETEFFKLAKEHHIQVFARSVFLQGLLLMQPKKIPSYLKEVVPYVQRFTSIAEYYGFQRKEAAILFSYCHPYIHKVIFGVETKEQLEENLQIIKKAERFMDCYEKISKYFRNKKISQGIISPNLWRK